MAAKNENQNDYLTSGEWMRDKALSHIPEAGARECKDPGLLQQAAGKLK